MKYRRLRPFGRLWKPDCLIVAVIPVSLLSAFGKWWPLTASWLAS